MPIVPEKLNDFRVFANGSPDLKGVADLQLPSFDAMTETLSGAGVAGEYESVTFGHFQSMKFVINWRMITDELIDFLRPEAISVDCRLANQEYDSTAGKHRFRPNRVFVRGQVTKNDLGKAAKGSAYEGSSEVEVTYIKVEREGKTIVELDKINYKFVVDGFDYMAAIREALGM